VAVAVSAGVVRAPTGAPQVVVWDCQARAPLGVRSSVGVSTRSATIAWKRRSTSACDQASGPPAYVFHRD
jgi:hypothetical protein